MIKEIKNRFKHIRKEQNIIPLNRTLFLVKGKKKFARSEEKTEYIKSDF